MIPTSLLHSAAQFLTRRKRIALAWIACRAGRARTAACARTARTHRWPCHNLSAQFMFAWRSPFRHFPGSLGPAYNTDTQCSPDEGAVHRALFCQEWLRGIGYRFIAVLLLCALTSSAIAQGQNAEPRQPDFPGLDIQAVPGWDGYVDQSAPMPFSFLLSNYSQDTIEGELTLTDPESERTINLGTIFIGQNGVRRFSSIQALPDWYQCVAKFSHEGRILWQRELALTTGKDFSEDLNYLLFVDDGTRMLLLPVNEKVGGGMGRFVPEPGRGRTVQPLAVKTWQIPQHPGPLTVAQAIVFSEATKVELLNEAQWDAVGKWIGLGGTVFVSEKSTDVIDRLKKVTPLGAQPGILLDGLTVYRCGTGSIREYAGPLFSATDVETPRQIAESASHLSRYNTISMLESTELRRWESRNSEITRMWVLTVFVIYTLLSSSAIFFFRMSRRNIMLFTGSVVGFTCVAAIILGGFLRTSRGDLRWVTVTTAGPGGLLQIGKIDVQSAGGRNTQMTIQGRDADLQLSESDESPNDYYYGYYHQPASTQPHFPAFTWQASRLTEEAETYQIKVPINPWGRRRLYATAFQPLERGVDIEISYALPTTLPPQQAAQIGTINGLSGTFNVKASSSLPFDLENCQILIIRSQLSRPNAGSIVAPSFSGSSPSVQDSGLQMEPVQSLAHLGRLSTSAPVIVTTSPGSGVAKEAMDQLRRGGIGELFPQLPYEGTTSVWIVGQVTKSPILAIDQQRSDFEVFDEQHWYVQEVLPEQMPPEWVELTQRLLDEELKAAAEAEATAKPNEP